MNDVNEIALFPPGRIVVTKGVQSEISANDVLVALIRHVKGDWGDVSDRDRELNEKGMLYELRLFSIYHASNGKKFWIITEYDRSHTTILLPDEY